MNPRICALITAAGQGKRFGGPKVTAVHEGIPFHTMISAVLKGLDLPSVWVFSSIETANIVFSTHNMHRDAVYTLNPIPGSDMFSSIIAGMSMVPWNTTHVLLWPVDFPFVSIGDVTTVITSPFEDFDFAAPISGNRHGHPVLFHRRILTRAVSTVQTDGLRGFLNSHFYRRLSVPTADSVTRNINFSKDLKL
ncbi:NTP transferase domain-containing protein [Myxococcota bacterium]|nr:NTP transferase domain-containing protein [Myxococcota bacterium]MBU1382727.1 NTP transferase domain-containing protein [Myxococcota bacterium]MBU1498396.1 NTP transferase domain-containing protein [Myxococcota bacterium]